MNVSESRQWFRKQGYLLWVAKDKDGYLAGCRMPMVREETVLKKRYVGYKEALHALYSTLLNGEES